MNLPSIFTQWCLEDRDDGWYVLSPWGGECGPFTEEEGAAKMWELRAHPVWCPACLVPMEQSVSPLTRAVARATGCRPYVTWRCPSCQLEIEQSEVVAIIRVNE